MPTSERQALFRHIVGVLCQCLYGKYAGASGLKRPITLKAIATCMGKATKVTDRELSHQQAFISDAAQEFVEYQLWLTDAKPVWYEGELS